MNAEDLASLLRQYRLRRYCEKALQVSVEMVLRRENVPFAREHCFNPANRVDFWLPDFGIALEIKIKGSLTDVTLQLSRYAEFPEVGEILLLTTLRAHASVPRRINNKPVVVEKVRSPEL